VSQTIFLVFRKVDPHTFVN